MDKKSIIEVIEDTIRSEDDLYSESETAEEAAAHINNMYKLSQAVTELKKVENERYKTDIEAELKDRMNQRDNEVKKDIADADRKLHEKQLIADKAESGLVVALNAIKTVGLVATTGAILKCECNGYTPTNSKAYRSLNDLSKFVIGKKLF